MSHANMVQPLGLASPKKVPTLRIGSITGTGFDDLGIKAFLDVDPRPTAVLDISTAPDDYALVYQNSASRLWEDRHGSGTREEIGKLIGPQGWGDAIIHTDSEGREWTCLPLKGRWLALSCNTGDEVGQRDQRALPTPDSRTSNRTTSESWKDAWDIYAAALGWDRFSSPITEHERLVLSRNWHETPLGAIDAWPGALRQAVSTMVRNPDPRLLVWGPEYIMIYNEACIEIFGGKHPDAIGRTVKETWAEIWDLIGPMIDKAMYEGLPHKHKQLCFMLIRNGFVEECFFDFTILPIAGSDERGNGALDQFTETTVLVTNYRRQQTVISINNHVKTATSLCEAWPSFVEGLRPNNFDIPYALFYSVLRSAHAGSQLSGSHAPYAAVFESSLGVEPEQLQLPRQISVTDGISGGPIIDGIRACFSGDIVNLCSDDGTLPPEFIVSAPGRAWDDPIRRLCILPIAPTSKADVVGFAIIGVNPRTPIDDRMSLFARVLRDTLSNAAMLVLLPEQSRRQKTHFAEVENSLTNRLEAIALKSEKLEERFTQMAQAAPIGMYMIDPDGNPTFVNDAYIKMMHTTRAHIDDLREKGIDWWKDFIVDEDIDAVSKSFEEMMVKGHSSVEFRGKMIWESVDESTGLRISGPAHFLSSAAAEFDEDGNVNHFQGWLTEISQERFTQRLLSQRLEEAQEAKRQSENFIDMTSHEMRNPLSAILQSADGVLSVMDQSGLTTMSHDVLVSPDTADSIIDAAQTIILCATHQKRIVDDILTLSKLDSNLLVISPDKARPSQLLERALRMYEAEMERAQIKSEVVLMPGFQDLNVDFVMLDSSRILQVVINLITNAIKFTQHGKIRKITLELEASLTPPTGRDQNLEFISIRPSRPANNFTDEWGNGQVVYLQFTVRDTGKGLTDDEMSLLFQRFSQASPKTYKQYGGSGLGLFISRELSELQGGQIGVCSQSGKGSTFAFYVKARRWIPGTPANSDFNKGKFDIHTPNMLESPVAFSPRGSISMDDTTAVRSARTRTASIQRSLVPAEASTDRLHILIVEDNIINQKVMAKQTRALGHVVHVANHGVEALEFIKQTPFWNPDLLTNNTDYMDPAPTFRAMIDLSVILMDQEMPTMDGLTCVRRIRELEKDGSIIGHIPVIAVTANARREQIGIALGAGMDEVVTKPFRIPTVVERAKKLVAEVAALSGIQKSLDDLAVDDEET